MSDKKYNAVKMKENDNVATAVIDLKAGQVGRIKLEDGEQSVTLTRDVPFGHKFALVSISKGSPVIKYGEEIGIALSDIEPGDHVHVHNVDSVRGKGKTTA